MRRPASHAETPAYVLFNSFAFIGLFLPVTLLGFFLIARRSTRLAALWLGLASLFFYGWWDARYVGLLLASITGNYLVGRAILRARECGAREASKAWLVLGIAANLALLFYFKYADFFISTLNAALDTGLPLLHLVLPLGISFFTFTQIAFLVDTARGEAKEYDPVHYLFFVTNYPHLIAGPILHHKEVMPQFEDPRCYRVSWEDVAVGLTIFAIGLAKKVLIADEIAQYVSPVFDDTRDPHFFLAWGAVLAYTLQLYFDFSGYSDMAIGLARMFGVRFPLNFDSPYKARSVIDFWRRWHMTLSRFLRDYLYVPLGGNRLGRVRRHVNLFVTMLLGGLWHGAGWTFVVWGALHGLYLIVNHGWRALRGPAAGPAGIWAWGLTFLAVMVGWVFFRARDLSVAFDMLQGMAGLNGIVLPAGWFSASVMSTAREALTAAGAEIVPIRFVVYRDQMWWTLGLLLIATLAPNTQQIMQRFRPSIDRFRPMQGAAARWTWQPTAPWLVMIAAVLAYALLMIPQGDRVSEFLYFQF
jgi:D-alanyl-lipoteichoic acid acyltransferase DltB (MBOAT superfamily)